MTENDRIKTFGKIYKVVVRCET